jgi:succinate dehydrogenase / fumarate reductase cytochrome b subunit
MEDSMSADRIRFNSSIMNKIFMAITGTMLCGFLLTHMAGNVMLFIGPEVFNLYGHKLTSNPLIYLAEAALASIFLVHIFFAIKVIIQNMQARPIGYYAKSTTGRGATFASSTMPWTGILFILLFLVIHLINLKFGAHYSFSYEGGEIRDLHKLTLEFFSKPISVILYCIAMIGLGFHVSHGLWSLFQTFGFDHPKYTPVIKIVAKLYAILIVVGYCSFPIWAYLQNGGQ